VVDADSYLFGGARLLDLSLDKSSGVNGEKLNPTITVNQVRFINDRVRLTMPCPKPEQPSAMPPKLGGCCEKNAS
jgi:hypothetical protein